MESSINESWEGSWRRSQRVYEEVIVGLTLASLLVCGGPGSDVYCISYIYADCIWYFATCQIFYKRPLPTCFWLGSSIGKDLSRDTVIRAFVFIGLLVADSFIVIRHSFLCFSRCQDSFPRFKIHQLGFVAKLPHQDVSHSSRICFTACYWAPDWVCQKTNENC